LVHLGSEVTKIAFYLLGGLKYLAIPYGATKKERAACGIFSSVKVAYRE
jgi:hypothetical protein